MSTQKPTILVVDDNPTNLSVLFDLLIAKGYTVLFAEDGESALERVKHTIPDLILLDIMMPGIDGYETCDRLNAMERTRDVPVIFMTALSDTHDKIRAFEKGAVDYITKPFQQAEVLARIHSHLTIQRLQRQLQKYVMDLQQLNASKDRFFSIISHDLRGQFASMRILSDVLHSERHELDPDKADVVHDLNRTINRSYRLMENLLDWALLQQGGMKYSPIELELREMLQTSVKMMDQNAKQKEQTLTAIDNPPGSEQLIIYADEKMVHTILRNLISNAIKFTERAGHIRVSGQRYTPSDAAPADYVLISIEDNGVGMSEKALGKIFRIDEKYQTQGTAQELGTGLGLILCKELVEKNDGQIWVTSEAGKGSTFYFTLPLATAENMNRLSPAALPRSSEAHDD